MDTASHFLIGLGLGALAHLTPEVAMNPALGMAVTIGTVIASEAPDFDFAYRLKGDAVYLKKHRGWTHSVPAWFVWPTLITLGMMPFVRGPGLGWIWLWCFAAVLIHVALDALNTFGTQALKPFSNKRLSKDVLMVFDPTIFVAQLLGVVIWWCGAAEPGPLFAAIDTLTVLYIVWRIRLARRITRGLNERFRDLGVTDISLTPTFRLNRWMAVIETQTEYIVGQTIGSRFDEEIRLEKQDPSPEWERIRRRSAVADTFFSIARHIHLERTEIGGRNRFVWTDLRFRIGGFFPFTAVVEVDRNGRIVSEALDWKGKHKTALTRFVRNAAV